MTLFYDLKQLNFVKSDKQCCMDLLQTVSLHLSNTYHCTPEVFFLVIKKKREREMCSVKKIIIHHGALKLSVRESCSNNSC